MAVEKFLRPIKSKKFKKAYGGDRISTYYDNTAKADKDGPCVVHVTKQCRSKDCDDFFCSAGSSVEYWKNYKFYVKNLL